MLNSGRIADKDDSFYHSSISKVTVHIVWYNKLCFRTNFEDAEKAYNLFPMPDKISYVIKLTMEMLIKHIIWPDKGSEITKMVCEKDVHIYFYVYITPTNL